MSGNYTTINENNQLIKELRRLKQWVVWGDLKIPFSPYPGHKMDVNKPNVWGTYEEACKVVAESNGNYKGVGFVLTDSDPYTFIDLDDPDKFVSGAGDGGGGVGGGVGGDEIRKIHKDILSKFDSYIEISPSGRGYHIIVKGVVANRDGAIGGRKSTKYKLEMYSAKHYMTVTGNAINATGNAVNDGVPVRECQEQLNDVYLQIFGESNDVSAVASLNSLNGSERYSVGSHTPLLRGSGGGGVGGGGSGGVSGAGVGSGISDRKVIIQALRAANGEAFGALMNGEWQGKYPSQSEADSSFLNMLKIYTRDPAQLARIFLDSGLGEREKARKVVRGADGVDASDYLVRTINFVLADGVGDGTYGVDISKFVERVRVIDNDSDTGDGARGDESNKNMNTGLGSAYGKVEPYSMPTGLLGELARHFFANSMMPVEPYSIAASLTLMSHISGNIYYVPGKKDNALNLYQCIMGESGAGKDDARSITQVILDGMEEKNCFLSRSKIYEGISSGSAMFRAMVKTPNSLLLLDEFGLYLGNALNDRGSSHHKDFITALMKMSNRGRSNFAGMAYADSKNDIPEIDQPYINLFGMSTISELMVENKDRQIANGFFNRILFIRMRGESPLKNRGEYESVSQNLLSELINIRSKGTVFGRDMLKGIKLNFGKGVREAILDLELKSKRLEGISLRYKPLWRRTEENYMKVAGLLSLGNGGIIELDHVEWAWKYVHTSICGFIYEIENEENKTAFKKEADKVLDCIKRVNDYSIDTRFGKICAKGYMPFGKIQGVLGISKKVLEERLQYLLDTGSIKYILFENKNCYQING